MAESYSILGVEVDALTIAQAVDQIATEAGKPGSKARMVTKPYVEFIDRAATDSDVRSLLNRSWLSLPDGVALQWATALTERGGRHWWRALGLLICIVVWPRAVRNPLPEKFGGTTFTWPLLERAAADRLRVAIIGQPTQTAIHHTAMTIKRRLPNIKIVAAEAGVLDGRYGHELQVALDDPKQHPEQELVAKLKKTQPDLILVGMGFPLQERVIATIAPKLGHGVFIGEGGTFDYASFGGSQPKAPGWMQKIGLEWLWRLIRQPKRWRRQLAIPRFIWRVYRDFTPR